MNSECYTCKRCRRILAVSDPVVEDEPCLLYDPIEKPRSTESKETVDPVKE